MKCPNQESLFEYVSIPGEMRRMARFRIGLHTGRCAKCQQQMQKMKATWESYFTPEPDITDSLMRVYSRLQADETLILKGWKLNDFRAVRSITRTVRESRVASWASTGALAVAAMLLIIFAGPQLFRAGSVPVAPVALPPSAVASTSSKLPFAQIRVEDKDNNRVQVHYVQPELLQSIEFETTSAR